MMRIQEGEETQKRSKSKQAKNFESPYLQEIEQRRIQAQTALDLSSGRVLGNLVSPALQG